MYHDIKCDVYNQIFIINFTYDYIFYPIISLFLTFKYDVEYLEIYFESFGGEIKLESNESKNISNIKANLPYYFYTQANLFQTSLITLRFKNLSVTPFDYLDIYEYKNQDSDFKITEKQKPKIEKMNNDESIISFSYQVKSFDISRIAFKITPKYNFDYLIAKINNMGGNFFLYNGDNNTFYNIYPESDFYFWIGASQFQKMNIYLKYNSIQENAITNIDIYEYYSECIDCEIYEHFNQIITPQRKDNNE